MTIHWRELLISILMILISHGLAEATPFSVFEYKDAENAFSLRIGHGPIDTTEMHPVQISTPNYQISFTIGHTAGFFGDFVGFGNRLPADPGVSPPDGTARHSTGVASHPTEGANPTPYFFSGFIETIAPQPALNTLTSSDTDSIPHPPNAGHVDDFSLNLKGSTNFFRGDITGYVFSLIGTHCSPISSSLVRADVSSACPIPPSVSAPEPSTLCLMGVGSFGALLYGWRRQRNDVRGNHFLQRQHGSSPT